MRTQEEEAAAETLGFSARKVKPDQMSDNSFKSYSSALSCTISVVSDCEDRKDYSE